MTPTWYDLLGVEPDASAEEIRAAWKSGIADLDPGDRRFRTLNEAAEVLLDPDRRAAYDATLEPEAEPEPEPEPASRTAVRVANVSAAEATAGPDEPRRGQVPAWLLAALAALIVADGRRAGYLAPSPPTTPIADATSDAQGAAERAVTTILAYDYRHLDEDQEAAGAPS